MNAIRKATGSTCHCWSTSVRLSKAFGSTPRVWLGIQMEYDLAQAEAKADSIDVKPAPRPAGKESKTPVNP
jgi:plasmid maintenance system antidote protein VapI